eukprot:3024558-Pleurochrysis_carterae.AAC.1
MHAWTMPYKWGHPVVTLPLTIWTITRRMTGVLRINDRHSQRHHTAEVQVQRRPSTSHQQRRERKKHAAKRSVSLGQRLSHRGQFGPPCEGGTVSRMSACQRHDWRYNAYTA